MKHFSKLLNVLLLNMLLVSAVYAKNGIMAGEGKVHCVQTKWFDIIYGDAVEESAAVLYQNADQIYQDLADMYEWENPPCRLPVILTTEVEVFNAYYSCGNYNHIVLYVTNLIEDLANISDSLLGTFRHELTHAFTYNMKSKITNVWTSVFGDASTFHSFCVTPGVAEGATLTSESFNGKGRLNDEFSKQCVKQAKIEGKFPKYSDVQGSRDINPGGSYYNFNGAFHEYLQRHYGLEKYAKFWYNCINNSITTSGAFRKAYKLNLRKEWKKFEEEYKVPYIPADPLKSGLAADFFLPSADDYSSENKKGALFSCLSQSEKGITYIDEYTKKLFFVRKESLDAGKVIPEMLFQYFYIKNAVQSADGKFIAITYYDDKDDNYRYHVAVYNTETKKWYKPDYHGVKNGIIVKKNNDYYLAALHFKGEASEIRISKLIIDEDDNISGEEEPVSFVLERNQIADGFVPIKNGVFAYILNDSADFSVRIMNVYGKLLSEYSSPVKAADEQNLKSFLMRYLSVNPENPDELYFCWVSEGTMPRVGKFNLADGVYTLSSEDLSGGIYYPLVSGTELFYAGKFYEYNKLFRKNVEKAFEGSERYFTRMKIFQVQHSDSSASEQIGEEDNVTSLEDIAEVKAYNPLKYLRGTFVPLSNLYSSSYDSNHRGSYRLPLGFTYVTNNPWDSLTYTLSAGYGLQTNSAAISFNVSGSTSTSSRSWSASALSEFDCKGFKAGEAKVLAGFNNQISNIAAISISPGLFVHCGRSNASKVDLLDYPELSYEDYVNFPVLLPRFGVYGSHDNTVYFYGSGSMAVAFNNVRHFYNNRYSKKGLYAGLMPFYSFSYNLTGSQTDFNYGDVTLFAEYYVPGLIPVTCDYGMTYNLPVKIFASVFSTNYVYSTPVYLSSVNVPSPDLAVLSAEIVLYGQEFQSSVSFLPFIYFYDVYVSAIGSVGFDYKIHKYENFGFLHTIDYINEIIDGQNKPIGTFAIKTSTGINFLNFGALARSSYKSNFSVIPTLVFPGDGTAPFFEVGFDIDINLL